MRRTAYWPGSLLVGIIYAVLGLSSVAIVVTTFPYLLDPYNLGQLQREGSKLAIALKEYATDHDGKFPAKLDDLPDRYFTDAGISKGRHQRFGPWKINEPKVFPPQDDASILSLVYRTGISPSQGMSLFMPTWEMQQALLEEEMSVVMPRPGRPVWDYSKGTLVIAINLLASSKTRLSAVVFENSWDSSKAKQANVKLEELENGEFRARVDLD